MKIHSRTLVKSLALTAVTTVRSWMGTLDYRVSFYDPTIDPVDPRCHGQKIYIFWHEYILFPIYLRGHCNLAMLLSQHNDADVLSHVAHHLGFEFVRGSSRRGGAAALRELLAKSEKMHLTITPDGPRGPRRRLAQGPVYLASKLGIPVVPMGFGYDRPWRFRSWDRFAIPRPFSRARAVVSPMMNIPPDLDRDGIEHYRREVERMLNRLTLEAEAWAEAGTRKVNEYVPRRERAGVGRETAPGWPLVPSAEEIRRNAQLRHGGTELAA
ncbi:MAG TPA: lysophospholipid acyltransferase family protein [Pirellulales bacterium]|jgi:hypothetical protein